jgi:hypothetical protein
MYATNGTTVPHPKEAHVTRWHADEFARGSYSFYAVGNPKNITGGLRRVVGHREGARHGAGAARADQHCSTNTNLSPASTLPFPAAAPYLPTSLQARWPSPLGACCLLERPPATSRAPCWGRT